MLENRPEILIKGLPRTGTNVVEHLIHEAFGIKLWPNGTSARADKHRPFLKNLGRRDIDLILIVVLKNPYAWIVSMHSWAEESKYKGTVIPHEKPKVHWGSQAMKMQIERYNHCYGNWLSQKFCDLLPIRYEDLLASTDDLIKPMEFRLDMERNQQVSLPREVIRPGHIAGESIPFDRRYYSSKQYLGLLTQAQRDPITAQIDWGLLKNIYTPIKDK